MNDYEILRENILFCDLSNSDLDILLKISQKIDVNQGEFFLREGEIADAFYYVLEGKAVVIKADKNQNAEYAIAHIEWGNAIGEIALLDNNPRSASVKAELPLKLLRIPFNELKKLAEKSTTFNNVIWRIAGNVGGRIRETNEVAVDALEKQVAEYKMRTVIGLFMVNVIVAICLFTFFLSWISHQEAGAVASTTITLPLTLGFVILLILIMKDSKLPLATFGLTAKNWRKAVIESILFTSVVCFFVLIVKWVLVHISVKYMGHHVFEPYSTINLEHSSTSLSQQAVWWIILAIYWLIVSPLQELIVRGGLQGPLEVFLTEKNKVTKAILVSNLMFATAHLFMGMDMAILVFFAGLYFGWLFSRHHTLIGVILAHAFLGTWTTMIIGL